MSAPLCRSETCYGFGSLVSVAALLPALIGGLLSFGSSKNSPPMKKNVLALVCALTVSGILAGCTTTRSHAAWDYKVISGLRGNSADLEQRINRAANDGWEVVTATTDDYPLVVLRRPK